MTRRSAPVLCLVLLFISVANGIRSDTGGRDTNQLRIKREISESEDNLDHNGNLIDKRSVLDGSLFVQDKDLFNSGGTNLNFDSSFDDSRDPNGVNKNRYLQRRSPNSNYGASTEKDDFYKVHDNVERKNIPGDLFPEAVMHNLEQTSDKVESDMPERKSKIPERNARDTLADKAVYKLGEELSVEVPLTTKVHESGAHEEGITKRNVATEREDVADNNEHSKRFVLNEDRVGKENGPNAWSKLITMKENSTARRDEVPFAGGKIFRDSLDDADANEDFQVKDKSADLEIHADSTGVKVKAKPASLQVVSNPHGMTKSFPGETHLEGVTAERRTFTPLLPEDEKRKHRRHRRHRFLHGLGARRYLGYPFLGRRHHHRHRHHWLPWLRHRQYINYPDIFERMRDGNPMPSAFNSPSSMGLPFSITPPMSSMINSPSMMPEGSPGMPQMMGGAGMNSPMTPPLLQRSPTMESNPSNRFGVPESPMGVLSQTPSVNQAGGMEPMGRTEPFGPMPPMMGSMNSMSGISSMFSGEGQMQRKNALEFWGVPNQDQLKALARGENVQKVLGTNEYGENIGGIMGGTMGGGMFGGIGGGETRGMQSGPGLGMGGSMGMNMPGELTPGMGGPSFNANGMGNGGMMGQFGDSSGGTSGAMFGGMNGLSGMMDNGVRRTTLFKKDDINKTEDYKKAMKNKNAKAQDKKPVSTHESEKFGEGILNKAKSLVAGEKHVAKNEHAPLLREHRIRKSSKSSHDEERRSLSQPKHSKKIAVKATSQKAKNVKGSKKDVAVQRPAIIYHPPPEVYHRPDIVVHRAPVLFHRPPIVYHQPPVVVHRPAVIYRQPPIVFHQPYPVINQPYYRSWDTFVTRPIMSLVGSNAGQTYNYLGTPPEITGYRKGVVPRKPESAAKKSKQNEKDGKETKRAFISGETKHKGSSSYKNTRVPQKKKKDVVVNRPPIIYHPPPEVYHRPEIVVHRAPLLIRRPPIVYHQPAVIVHRPPVVYHQPPIIFHQPSPTVNQPILYSHDNFVVHPSFFATHHGSVVSDAGQLLGIPNTVSVPDVEGFPFQAPGLHPGGLGAGGLRMTPTGPMGRRKRSLLKNKKKSRKHESAKRKNAILVRRPPIVYHPPPEVYHRPDIVVHRAPIVIHRGPIVYHQPPVVVHRPAVMYHQPPLLFHQPPPVVHQPLFTAHDTYTTHPTLTLVSSSSGHLSPGYLPTLGGLAVGTHHAYGKSAVPKKRKRTKSGSTVKSEESNGHKKDYIKPMVKKEISNDEAKTLAHFFSNDALGQVSVRQLVSIIKDRQRDKNDIKPIFRDSKLKALTIRQLAVVEDFLNGMKMNEDRLLTFLTRPDLLNLRLKKLGTTLERFSKTLKKSKTEEKLSSKKEEISKHDDEKKAEKKNAVLVKRPPIVYHPPPEVYHRPDIVVHRAPLVIHRAPIVYHQPPVVVHRPAVVYHQPPVLFHQPPPMVRQPVFASHDVYHQTVTLTPAGGTVTNQGTYLGVPTHLVTQGVAFGKSKVPAAKRQGHSKKYRRSTDKRNEAERASKKNAVLVKRPPIIYHPPPEVYHRPDIVVHRAPIVIHRAPLVYHQPPVIVHRPAVVYHQPAVVFHQPPPVVHQPMFASQDTFTAHDTLTLGSHSTAKLGDYLGPPPGTFSVRKETVPRNKDVLGTHRDTIERKHDAEGHPTKKDKKENLNRRSRLRKLILSLQKDESTRKSENGQQALMIPSSSMVLQRPPIFLQQRPSLMVNPPVVQPMVQPMVQPVVQRVLTPVPVLQQVIRPVAVPVVYHHHHWPVHIHHHHMQPVVVAPRPVPVPIPHVHYTTFYHTPYHVYNPFGVHYSPYFGKSIVPKAVKRGGHSKKERIDVHDYGIPVQGHVGHINGHSHVVKHHGYITQHPNCPSHCSSCYPSCPSDCTPQCVTIVHHQHHRPQHIFVDHQHHHHFAQTHFHDHHWPVHHFDVQREYPNFIHRHVGHSYHHYGRRDVQEDADKWDTVPHYWVYRNVKHWHPSCLHHDSVCHHTYHPSTIYHEHRHPASVYHHHHYHPYPVYHHHEHVRPVIYHHVKPYPVHHHHDHYVHSTWHHDHHHDHYYPPEPYPIPVEVPSPPVACPVPIPFLHPYPVPAMHPCSVHQHHVSAPIVDRSFVPKSSKQTRKSDMTPKPLDKKGKNKKKDVVVNRPPIIYHPPPEVYHRPEIVVHRAPVLIHRPPIVYHQSSVVVHRPAVVYHQPPIVFHQPSPTVNQPILYSHDNFVVRPTMYATHAGTMVEGAGHFVGLPRGPISSFFGSPYYNQMGGLHPGFHRMAPYATPLGRRRRSTKPGSKKADRKNSIVVHRPPVIYHPPPEIYHRPSMIVHRPDILIHRPPIVYHQSPVVLHRPPVVYHQTPIVFHQPPPVVNQPVFHSHDAYAAHPVFTHYDSDVHHAGSYYGVPHYGEAYHGFHGGFDGFHGGFGGLHGGFDGWHGSFGRWHGGFGGWHGGFHGFDGFGPGFGRSKVEKAKTKKKVENKEAKRRTRREERAKTDYSSRKSPAEKKRSKSERAGRKNSVVVNRPPMVFHPEPEIYHRPPYVVHQPDIVIHRPPVVYHQSPVLVHHPPVTYHQPPVMFHQHHPVVVAPRYHGHHFFGEYPCIHGSFGCFGGGFHGGFHGGFGHGFHGVFHHGYHGYPFLYGKSGVSKPKRKRRSDVKGAKGSKKHDIIIHRPPLVYHPPPEIYHRPDIVVHRPDVLVHRQSVVYDQPAVVLHRPAVVYHEPPVVFHQPPPMVHLPVYHAEDAYTPHPVFSQAGSHVDYDHSLVGVPDHLSHGLEDCHDYFGCPGYGGAYAFGKSKIEKHSGKRSRAAKTSSNKYNRGKSGTKNAQKKYHLIVHRPPIVYHPPPTVYHRPDVVVNQPDIVIHRPSFVVHPPPVIVHKPSVVYHEPAVVFHQPSPAVDQPVYHSHDAYTPHPVYTQVESEIHHGGNYLGHPYLHQDFEGVYHDAYHDGYHGDIHDHLGFGDHGYFQGSPEFLGFGKSKILKSEKRKTTPVGKPNKEKTDKKGSNKNSKKDRRDTTSFKRKRFQFPRVQSEKTETGTKKNSIVVRRPPIIYHPPPEVYHRPDIVVHRAPIVIQRAPLVYHQAPVIVHRPAVVYHQPAVVFHQPQPTVNQPVFHSMDNFELHPHLRFSQPASNVEQVGNYVGVPDEVMHRSDIARDKGKQSAQKNRRDLFDQNITPVTPLNFFHGKQVNIEQPRSTIPYPSLHALHPYRLSYASFPWGLSPRHKRYITGTPEESPEQNLLSLPTASFPPLQFTSLSNGPYHPVVLRRPNVNVNVETVKSKVPEKESRSRRQTPETFAPFGKPMSTDISPMSRILPPYQYPAVPYNQMYPFLESPRPHVNVNVETVKSVLPSAQARSRRQVLAGLPVEDTQPSLVVPPVYPHTYAPVASAIPKERSSDDTAGVYRDLLGALYGSPTEAKRRPKVNIVVQTSKSSIPTPEESSVRKSAVPDALTNNNVDAFSTMPEVTTIEPPLLRDGVRVNMVNLGIPTVVKKPLPGDFATRMPSPNDDHISQFGRMMGPRGQGEFGVDRWKKSGLERHQKVNTQRKPSISEPAITWRDENAEKKSSVPDGHSAARGGKRYNVDRFEDARQIPSYQAISDIQERVASEQRPESVVYGAVNPYDGSPEPQRPHINVNVQTVKNVLPKAPNRRTLDILMPHRKRQLIGTVPLVSLVQPTTNNVRASLKSAVPSAHTQPRNTPQPVSKRQQVMGRLPIMQIMPQLKHAISNTHAQGVKLTKRYPAYAVQDAQPAFQIQPVKSDVPVQSIQTAPKFEGQLSQPLIPQVEPDHQPLLPGPVEPVPPVIAASLPNVETLYPWGGRPRPHVDVNVETVRSKIPRTSSSAKVVNPRFKRKYPLLYNVIKAKARIAKERRETMKRRGKRQIPFLVNEDFFQRLIPDPYALAKRAFYGSVPRYPMSPTLLFPRAPRHARPASNARKIFLGNPRVVEVGRDEGASSATAASLLKNEFSQNFDDIAKIQRQEVNAIKGMSTMSTHPTSPLVSMPQAQATSAFAASPVPPPAAAEAPLVSSLPEHPEQSHPLAAMPFAAQQSSQQVTPAAQVIRAAEQPITAPFAAQSVPEMSPAMVEAKPVEQESPQPVTNAVEAASETVAVPAKASFADEASLHSQLPGVPPGFPLPGVQFVPVPQATLPFLEYPPRPFTNPILPQPDKSGEEEDRPSVNIQIQTSKSKIPKLHKEKLRKKSHT